MNGILELTAERQRELERLVDAFGVLAAAIAERELYGVDVHFIRPAATHSLPADELASRQPRLRGNGEVGPR